MIKINTTANSPAPVITMQNRTKFLRMPIQTEVDTFYRLYQNTLRLLVHRGYKISSMERQITEAKRLKENTELRKIWEKRIKRKQKKLGNVNFRKAMGKNFAHVDSSDDVVMVYFVDIPVSSPVDKSHAIVARKAEEIGVSRLMMITFSKFAKDALSSIKSSSPSVIVEDLDAYTILLGGLNHGLMAKSHVISRRDASQFFIQTGRDREYYSSQNVKEPVSKLLGAKPGEMVVYYRRAHHEEVVPSEKFMRLVSLH